MNLLLKNVFSKDFFLALVNGDDYPRFECAVNRYTPEMKGSSKMEALEVLYRFMYKKYKCEYIYKNTLLRRIVLGRHSVKTCSALPELRIRKAKADMVVINGAATVYEIKTDLDNLSRLDNQIEEYYKAFDSVMLVASEKHMHKLLHKYRETPVGISTLSAKGFIHEEKASEPFREKLQSDVIFSVLRKREYESILMKCDIELPQCVDTLYYRYCKALFSEIPAARMYSLFLETLKARNAGLSAMALNDVPNELKLLGYVLNPNTEEVVSLNRSLQMAL